FNVEAQHDAVGGRAFALLDLQLLLEKAKALDPVLAPLDLESIERVALVDPEFTADDLVSRRRVAGDVDPLDIDAWRRADLDGEVHHLFLGVAVIGRTDVGERIAERARSFIQIRNSVLDLFRVEPGARADVG